MPTLMPLGLLGQPLRSKNCDILHHPAAVTALGSPFLPWHFSPYNPIEGFFIVFWFLVLSQLLSPAL